MGTRQLHLILFVLTLFIGVATRANSDDDFAAFDGEFTEQRPIVDVADPLELYNRCMFAVNDRLYFWCLKPIAQVWSKVPEPARIGVSRFFRNVEAVIRITNTTLQCKFEHTWHEVKRLAINSTVGLLGFRDPASSHYDIPRHDEDFGQTLGHYGVGDAVPVVLPFLGPANLRDIVGLVVDAFLDPVSYIRSSAARYAVRGTNVVNRTSLSIGQYESIKSDALDPYTFVRDAYRQRRWNQVAE